MAPAVFAHEGPESVIADLNARMLKSGPSADLLFRRATEFRALRDDVRAAQDLQRAIRLDDSLAIARLDLARLQLQLQREATNPSMSRAIPGEPLETLQPLLESPDPSLRIAALALKGEIHLAYCQWESAADNFSAVVKSRPEELQWRLWYSEALQKLGRHTDCLAELRDAYALTGSPVIRARLCDVLIDVAGNESSEDVSAQALIDEAQAIVEDELEDSRLKSAWRIRRAELLLLSADQGSANLEESRRELTAALEELNQRLATNSPDPRLIQDRDRALALLR